MQPPLLRPFAPADAPAVLDAFDDPQMHRQGAVASLDRAREWVASMAPGQTDRDVFAIDVGGRSVGAVGVTGIDRVNRIGWFWYWIHRRHRGAGLTSRAAATVATWALTRAALDRLELGHRATNPASGAVARAAGFRHEGVERGKFLIDGARVDVVTYGRLATDPVPPTGTIALQT